MNCLMRIAITFSMNWATVTSGDHLTFHNKQHVVAIAIAIAVLLCCTISAKSIFWLCLTWTFLTQNLFSDLPGWRRFSLVWVEFEFESNTQNESIQYHQSNNILNYKISNIYSGKKLYFIQSIESVNRKIQLKCILNLILPSTFDLTRTGPQLTFQFDSIYLTVESFQLNMISNIFVIELS